MKVWTKVHIRDFNRQVTLISSALTRYLFEQTSIDELTEKYNISSIDRISLEKKIANRVAGLFMLYLSHDTKRINDIVNKYHVPDKVIEDILPEIEGYIEK